MGFSIIVPVREINDYIWESVPIALELDYEDFEIIILPNEPPEEVSGALTDERVRIIPSGRVSPAVKRDLGAKQAKFEHLAFIDDDAYPRRDWLRMAESLMSEKGVECLGGPAVTPPSDTLGQQASGLFFETRTGGGGMAYRYVPVAEGFYVDDFPSVNLIVSKRAFEAVGGFDNAYWPGEDTKFCLELVKAGYKIWYSPELLVWHHRRSLFRPHLEQVGKYGRHRGYFAKKFPETSRRLVYFMPSLFLLGNAGLLLGTLICPRVGWLWLPLLGIYFVIVVADVISRTRRPLLIVPTVVTVFLSHLTYGAMFLRGLFTRNFNSDLR